ncbi:MAG: telomerase protein component 1, partial [Acidobacteriota bacterium]|nr:telomerase protein component 1 [Acidobacteriota bacterium]
MENIYKDFDKYGLHYLPTHLLECQLWDEIAGVLCDLQFVEAKSAAGLAFELVSDYTAALRCLSEDSEKPQELLEKKYAVELYMENLMAYAEGKTENLNPIPSVEHRRDKEIGDWVEKKPVSQQDVHQRLKAFGKFAKEQVYYLE